MHTDFVAFQFDKICVILGKNSLFLNLVVHLKKKINVHNNIALSWSGLINGALFLPKRSWAFFSDESKQFLSSSNVTEGVKKVTNICLTHGMSEIKKYM